MDLSKACIRTYRIYKRKKLVAFMKAMGLSFAQMDADEVEQLGKEMPSDDFVAGWNACAQQPRMLP